MALELQIPPPFDFDFDFSTGRESPSIDSRPSTPKRFGEVCFSCPTSPAWNLDNNHGFYDDLSFSNFVRGEVSTSSSPYNWDGRLWLSESPNTVEYNPESLNGHKVDELEAIKSPLLSPQTTKSKNSERKKSFWSTFSPKRKKEIKTNPYQTVEKGETGTEQGRGRGRGRERGRVSCLADSRSGRRATRSLSPLRVSKYPWEEQQEEEKTPQNSNQNSSSTKPPLSAKCSRKWRLRDFLLFRSASEGRASEKDPFRKYAEMYRKHHVVRSPGSKSTDGSGTSVIPGPRRGQVSAHELHYTVNKAISEDMKKKTFLPYKQGILGRLAVNPAVHALAYGYGSVPSSYG